VTESSSTIELTVEVVASYLGNHQVAATDVPALIRASHGAFTGAPEGAGTAAVSAATKAQIRKSVTPEAIISFEDGRGYKVLRRHLATCGLTPAGYRLKWGLPPDYPMVAPAYSEQRSAMAKARGLGRKAAPPPPAAPAPRKGSKSRAAKAPGDAPTVPPARPARPKKSGA
jgi:predicted transcriptional regulator